MLENAGWKVEWADIIQNSNKLLEIEINLSGKKWDCYETQSPQINTN